MKTRQGTGGNNSQYLIVFLLFFFGYTVLLHMFSLPCFVHRHIMDDAMVWQYDITLTSSGIMQYALQVALFFHSVKSDQSI